MPLKKYKDGKLIEEVGTKPPTPEQAEKMKQKKIAEQIANRGAQIKKRETASPVEVSVKPASTKPAASE